MNWLSTFAPDWSQTLVFLLDNALKGSVVIGLAALAAWLLRRNSAAARHSVWSAAITAQLVIPVLSAVLPTWRVPVVAQPSWIARAPAPVPTVPNAEATSTPSTATGEAETDRIANTPTPASPPIAAAPEPRWNVSPITLLAALWLLGCVAVLVRLAAGTAVVSRMAVRGQRVIDEKWLGLLHRLAVTLKISRPLTLLRSDALGVPVTWGIIYPVVLLPEDADEWPEERRQYVLVHEMAHVKRLDAFTQLIAQFAQAIFWFNPLVWIAVGQMRRERENACDDYVLTHGTRPSEYANDLLQLVQDIDTEGHRAAAPAFAALAMARRSEFEGRMLSILNPRIRRHGLTRGGVAMGLLGTLIIAAPLSALSPFATIPAKEKEGLPESFRVNIIGSGDSASPGISALQGSSKPTSQRTESSGASVETCDRAGNLTGTRTSIHDSDERPEYRDLRFVQSRPGRCVEADLFGIVRFTSDERDIADIGRGARVRFREVSAGVDREMTITSEGGQPRRAYSVSGRSSTVDDEGRAWLASMILTLLRESAYNAPERVRRLDQEGGVERVLAEIDAIRSSGAKHAYYGAFLELGRPLNDSTLTHMLTRMRREFAASSGDLRSLLQKIPARSVRTTQVRTAFTGAMASIESDGDKAAVLAAQTPTADRELLIDIMDVARTISSDGDKARLLMISAASYLNPQDQRLREAFFSVAETVESDGDLARVLISAAPYGHADAAVTEAAIEATRHIESDGDIANVLTYIATQKLLTTGAVRDAYMEAARNIDSDGDRARVLRAAMMN